MWVHLKSLVNICMYVCLRAKSFQPCPTLCDPMDLALQAPLSLGILQARILEWVAMPPPGSHPLTGL